MDRNSLTIFAVLTLSVSNLFVGITTQNKLLILASAGISATLAILYIVKELSQDQSSANRRTTVIKPNGDALFRRAPFPLWVFGVILFIALPALLLFMQMLTD